MVYSKFLNEYIVITGVNDQFTVNDSGGADLTVTLTAGRYRDMIAFVSQVASDTTNESSANGGSDTFTGSVNNSTGIVTFSSDNTLNDWDFNTATYGTTLRNDLGFAVDQPAITSNTIVGTLQHVGGFYPSEPVEDDSRPDKDGVDRWTSDTFQTRTRAGLVATKGGSNLIYSRDVGFLLPQGDLGPFQTWLARCSLGYSFAYYHDRDQAWDGPSNEYDEYKIYSIGATGVSYRPQRVDMSNDIWHRQTINMTKRVVPGT